MFTVDVIRSELFLELAIKIVDGQRHGHILVADEIIQVNIVT